ncbi:MAG: DUF1858 domain-containing protein [Defluviitaleaceae bacterium]|nr:DUF1858 domain-containing protein [Defluviitaleaceae bacterium]
MKTVNKEMIISDLLQIDTGLAVILRNHGMHCVGCPSASGETLAQAASGHGMDVDGLIEEMNVYLNNQGNISE